MFRESDFEWLQIIGCMKKAGMSIRDIRQYIQLAMQGDDTIDTRLQMFHHQRQVLLDQIGRCSNAGDGGIQVLVFTRRRRPPAPRTSPIRMAEEEVPQRFRAIWRELTARSR